MAATRCVHPVSTTQHWPIGSRETAEQLHRLLSINHLQWHAFKSQPQRRAAEQLAAALVQLLDPANPPASPLSTAQREQAIALLEHSLGWLKGERRDPGCPQHGH
jgi:hypothetical protein